MKGLVFQAQAQNGIHRKYVFTVEPSRSDFLL